MGKGGKVTQSGGFDVVVVRKSGPVRSLRVSGWWTSLLLGMVLLLIPVGLGGGWLTWRQHNLLMDLAEETRLLSLRAERLEALVQEQETRDILATFEERPDSPERRKAGKPAASAAPPAEQAGDEGRTAPLAEGEARAALANEPQTSNLITLRNVEQKIEGGDLVVSFDLINERESGESAMGYITVVARGLRQGKPWLEAWPPMRLTALGRPQNFRRGTPFSVQRFRKVKARVAAVSDKKFERLEFVVYTRQGDLAMVVNEPVAAQSASRPPKGREDN